MTGIYWVIIIFVLQAVIGALAKRAQKNAQAQPPRGAKGPGFGRPAPVAPPSPVDPATAMNPTSSAVLPPRPTMVGRAPGAAVADGRQPAPFRSSPVKPVPVKPVSVKPVSGKSVSVKPVSGKPVSVKPVSGKPGASVPQRPSQAKLPQSRLPQPKLPQSGVVRPNAAATQGRTAPPQVLARSEPREEADAMSSRAKVAESVAKIRSIESSISGQRVVGLGGSTPAKPAAVRAASDFSAARIAEAFRNPQRIREAIIMAEVIGPPRGVR